MIRKLECRLAENIRMKHKEVKNWKKPKNIYETFGTW